MINIAIKRTGPLDWTLSYLLRSLYTVNPILSPPPRGGGGLFIPSLLEAVGGGGAYWRRWAYLRGFINLETTMVSVLHKELEYKVEKLKSKTF